MPEKIPRWVRLRNNPKDPNNLTKFLTEKRRGPVLDEMGGNGIACSRSGDQASVPKQFGADRGESKKEEQDCVGAFRSRNDAIGIGGAENRSGGETAPPCHEKRDWPRTVHAVPLTEWGPRFDGTKKQGRKKRIRAKS